MKLLAVRREHLSILCWQPPVPIFSFLIELEYSNIINNYISLSLFWNSLLHCTSSTSATVTSVHCLICIRNWSILWTGKLNSFTLDWARNKEELNFRLCDKYCCYLVTIYFQLFLTSFSVSLIAFLYPSFPWCILQI